MRFKKAIKWLGGGILALYIYFKFLKGVFMSTNPLFQCYGVTNPEEVKLVSKVVSIGFALGANSTNLYNQLVEIAQAESKCGQVKYNPERGYGYGIWQFDKVAFDDIKGRFLKNDRARAQATLLLQYDPCSVIYPQLKESPLLACIYARMYLYCRIPEPVGETPEKRAEQWKKYYNTELGKGTIAGYLAKVAELYA